MTTSPSRCPAPSCTCAESGRSVPVTLMFQHARPDRVFRVMMALPLAPAGPGGTASLASSLAERTVILGAAAVVVVAVEAASPPPPHPAASTATSAPSVSAPEPSRARHAASRCTASGTDVELSTHHAVHERAGVDVHVIGL